MSIATITAARILAGQQAGGSGEQHRLAFESFPHTALARTYNTNQQTPDSAGTMTAMATGVKTYAGAIAVDQRAERSDCSSIAGRELVSIVDLAKSAGLAAGIVTTSRITHATPAVLYAKSPERRWEADVSLPGSAREAGCRDIARQLVEYPALHHPGLYQVHHAVDEHLGGDVQALVKHCRLGGAAAVDPGQV
ncbi:MAG: alkaline phosphatase, partial [Wenzhouxiangellaceae bacterium]